MTKPVVLTLERYGSACPTQWDARTEDGRELYIRYRWGRLRAGFHTTQWWDWIYEEYVGPPGDRYMTTEDMMRHTAAILDWSRVEIKEGT